MSFTAPIKNEFRGYCTVCRDLFEAKEGWLFNSKAYCAKHLMLDQATLKWEVNPFTDPMPSGLHKGPKPTAPAAPVDAKDLTAKIVTLTGEHFMQHVPGIVASELLKLNREVIIQVGTAPKVTVKQSHAMLPTILQTVSAGVSPFLVGPAGSGKTTLAEQVAMTMKLPFYMAARVTSEFKLVGFVNAQGGTVRTQFREAYEHGGIFLFDEVDASDPDALTAFNAALSNGLGDFPDGMVKRHKNFHAIAAGNTYGRGADRQYVGRNQLDAATLDRFQVFDVDYDEQLERSLAGNADWVGYVQSVRKAVELEKVRHIVSPRASIAGARMLAAGMDRKVVEQACVWKGLPEDAKARVIGRMTSMTRLQGAA